MSNVPDNFFYFILIKYEEMLCFIPKYAQEMIYRQLFKKSSQNVC